MSQQPCKTLPPVGVVCEYDDCEKGWVRTRILAHHPDGTCAWHESVEPDGFEGDRTYSTDSAPAFRLIPGAPSTWGSLPPRGALVRIKGSDFGPRVTPEVVGHHDGMAIVCVGPDFDDYEAHPEQDLELALSEEERAMEEMRNVMASHAEVTDRMAETLAAWLYRAGCRIPATGDDQ